MNINNPDEINFVFIHPILKKNVQTTKKVEYYYRDSDQITMIINGKQFLNDFENKIKKQLPLNS